MSAQNDLPANPQRPYDDSMWDHFNMYDNVPYKWDASLEKHLKLESGNVIKAYRCKILEPYEIKH